MAETEACSTVTYSRFFDLALKRRYKRLLLMQWSTASHNTETRLPLTSGVSLVMARLGPHGNARFTSVVPPKADISVAVTDFRF